MAIRIEHITDADLQGAQQIRKELQKIFSPRLELVPVAITEFVASKAGVTRKKLEREIADNQPETYFILAARMVMENPSTLEKLYDNCRSLAAMQH